MVCLKLIQSLSFPQESRMNVGCVFSEAPCISMVFQKLPKVSLCPYVLKTSANGQKCFPFAVLNFGIASQLSPSRHPLLILLNIFYDGLGVFPAAGWLARSSFLCLVSAGSGTEIYFLVFVVGPVGIMLRGRESGWLLGRWTNSLCICFYSCIYSL